MEERNQLAATRGSESLAKVADDTNRPATLPAVDIYENATGITLLADLPGVSKDRLSIKVQSNELLIEGEAAVQVPAEVRLVHNELREPLFRRSFTLGHDLDKDNITANLKHGVLTLQIPRLREAQPRKISVTVT
ncbi:MAG TPA: Hsp20/alpha crystallin family protein [Achromobacter sp.]|uniref:Heat-shock protein Hsp20 n=1 Tax=Achromobacter spanius TaxID=217203 RepID=A0A2S5GRN0_9BURK|nr:MULTISPECIES: Hsp20/alpha crystallin family protein [Achromobacter]AYD64477.1 Hsp20/alpha crystallin family protein [Achromobacter sp. B7]MDX3984067.1 Hsp20/alpha crystallin family protein [Achromobacter sp.]PPA75649.1 heat-shock protein Hsp20 [Achromobacter spanius]QYJ23923.1 Hsp20/alpha crystallin family protein [Achromobacter sp. ES-001]HBL66087.1 Hsp20/alpha crystallin family protein [Achromobacter sp.]